QVLGQKGIETITGGYDIQGVLTSSAAAASGDLRASIANGGQQAAIASVSSVAILPIEIRQVGAASQQWLSYRANGYDSDYMEQVSNHYGFKLRAPGFETDAQVWQALRERDDVIVLGRSDVPSSQAVRLDQNTFMAEGFFWEDEAMPALEVEVRLPQSTAVRRLKVIGVLNSSWIGNFVGGVHGGSQSVAMIAGAPVPAALFFIDAREGTDSMALAQAIEKEFFSAGLETTSMQQLIATSLNESKVFNELLRGFIALGLLIGIASLGVISTRSVVERRQQIGMLRAIGYHRSMVLSSFLFEAAFIAVLGILIGTLLGLNTGWNIINQFAKEQTNLVFDPPIFDIIMIDVLALVCALLATALPAWRASRVFPAEALRYE
nr:ABC transporter permease [Herpetosiphonaceae bacterium]